MEVGEGGAKPSPTEEDLSAFDEEDPDAGSGEKPGPAAGGYVITEATLTAWTQRRSYLHSVIEASATDAGDPAHGGVGDRSLCVRPSRARTNMCFGVSLPGRRTSSRSWPATPIRQETRTK